VAAAQAETIRRTWQLARHQMIWFRRQSTIRWVEITEADSPETVSERVWQSWQETGPAPLHIARQPMRPESCDPADAIS
jgi:hypothetical protein